ncbi:unnamed protein product, partial [Iphiclides podalirius]
MYYNFYAGEALDAASPGTGPQGSPPPVRMLVTQQINGCRNNGVPRSRDANPEPIPHVAAADATGDIKA